MEIKPPSAVITPPHSRRERTLPVEGDRAAPALPLEGETDFARLLAEELGEVRRTASRARSTGQLMEQAREELEQSARHLVRAHQFLDLAKKGSGQS